MSEATIHRLYLIADVQTALDAGVDLVEVVRGFVSAGGRMVSLRGKGVDDRTVVGVGRKVAGLVFAAGGTFLVHRRVDIAQLLGADGVHSPSSGFRPAEVYRIVGRPTLVGKSCHDADDVVAAASDGVGFATLGPVFESVSKPGYGPRVAPSAFRSIAEQVDLALYALGGVVPQNVADCFDAGAVGVAVVGGVVTADDPAAATGRYLEAIRQASRAAGWGGAATGEC